MTEIEKKEFEEWYDNYQYHILLTLTDKEND